jgi:hypothetical protein
MKLNFSDNFHPRLYRPFDLNNRLAYPRLALYMDHIPQWAIDWGSLKTTVVTIKLDIRDQLSINTEWIY